MTGKNKYTLPNHIIPFKNPDKEFQEEGIPRRSNIGFIIYAT